MQKKGLALKKNRGLSEGQLAVLLVLPAVLVIVLIAVYPVMRTLQYSFFDLRLNHPTKNTTNLSYSLDLEKYADGVFTLRSQLKKAASVAQGEGQADIIERIARMLEEQEADFFCTDERRESLDRVNALLDAYEPVQDESLRYTAATGEEIETYKAFLAGITERIGAALEAVPEAEKQLTKAGQAVDTLSFAVVEPNFVGAQNYRQYLSNPRLWTSVVNTSVFTLFAVGFELILGILVALLMNHDFPGRGLIRACVLIPWSIPASTSATMWRFMYDGQYGIMAKLLAMLGIIPSASFILTTRAGSMFGMILSDVWKTTPFMALLLLAGLQTIDATLYEAACVDGSGRIHSFFTITLPLLKPTILVSVLFRSLDTFKAFDLMSVMTNGANNTESISLYAYKIMFAQMDFGGGSTISIILFLMVFLLCMFYIKGLGADLFKTNQR